MKFIKKLFGSKKKTPEERTSKDGETLTEFEFELMEGKDGKVKCPDCGSNLLAGPTGGGSQNCLCASCHSEFNHYGFGCARISDKKGATRERRAFYGQIRSNK